MSICCCRLLPLLLPLFVRCCMHDDIQQQKHGATRIPISTKSKKTCIYKVNTPNLQVFRISSPNSKQLLGYDTNKLHRIKGPNIFSPLYKIKSLCSNMLYPPPLLDPRGQPP